MEKTIIEDLALDMADDLDVFASDMHELYGCAPPLCEGFPRDCAWCEGEEY